MPLAQLHCLQWTCCLQFIGRRDVAVRTERSGKNLGPAHDVLARFFKQWLVTLFQPSEALLGEVLDRLFAFGLDQLRECGSGDVQIIIAQI